MNNVRYCSECGKPLKLETDFERSFFTSSVKLIKKCINCGHVIDIVDIKTK